MDTLTFFQTILPDVGTKYLVIKRVGLPYHIHRGYQDLEAMAAAVANFNRDPQIEALYHACACYKQPYLEVEKNGKTIKQYRKPANWRAAKAFWIDLDVGAKKHEEGKGYLNQKSAAQAVFQFSKDIGWPKPMLVSSGYGLHAYWPLQASIAHSSWSKCADLLKAACALFGLLADPTRSADFASVLRPVGSSNRKDLDNPKKVHVLCEVEPMDVRALYATLKEYCSTHNVVVPASDLPALPAHLQGAEINSDLTAHLAFANTPVDADQMADKCKQVSAMRNTAGDVSYEHWRGVIGLLTFCEDGRTKAEDWSSERASTGHDSLDWNVRYDSWDSGPTKCETLAKCNPEGCAGCEFKGKITSPVALGRVIPATKDEEVKVATETDAVEIVVIPAYPGGYQWNNGLLSRILPDKDNINQVHSFTTHQFYPTMRIKGEDGAYRIGMRMHSHDSKVRDFQMPFEAMASPTEILKHLARYELMQSNHPNAGTHLTAYLRDALEQLKRRVAETNTLTAFGWKDEMRGFLIGDRYYSADGTSKRVLLGGYAAQKQAALTAPQGTMDGYAKPLNHVYAREGMECLQYAICSGWGSILNPFCEELYCGLLCAITGGDSGKGKSTAAYASVYAFGDANAMALKSNDAGTRNALWATVGAFNNIPLIFDELTGVEADWFSNFTYTLSLGEERARLQSTGSGVKFASQAYWRMSPFGTANKDLHGVLAANQANSQAEAVRLIQIHVDSYNIPKLDETEVAMALEQMKRNRGVAGAALIQYAVTHTDEIAERIRARVSTLAKHLPGTKYRFYRSHAACTLVAAEMAVALGVCTFSVQQLETFAIELMQKLAKEITINNTVTSEDAFSRMVAALTPGIVVTSEYRDSRSALGVETPRNQVRGPVIGRYVLGTRSEHAHAGRLFLCQKSMRDWCMKNRTDFGNMVEHLRVAGALVTDDERVTLTRGTDMPRVQQRCVVIDLSKMEASGPVLIVDNVVVGSQSAV